MSVSTKPDKYSNPNDERENWAYYWESERAAEVAAHNSRCREEADHYQRLANINVRSVEAQAGNSEIASYWRNLLIPINQYT